MRKLGQRKGLLGSADPVEVGDLGEDAAGDGGCDTDVARVEQLRCPPGSSSSMAMPRALQLITCTLPMPRAHPHAYQRHIVGAPEAARRPSSASHGTQGKGQVEQSQVVQEAPGATEQRQEARDMRRACIIVLYVQCTRILLL